MSEKTILNRLTIIENYVRGIFQKLTNSVYSLQIDTTDNLEIYTEETLAQVSTFAGITRLSPNEVSKSVATYPSIGLQFPQNTSLRNAYLLAAAPSISPLGRTSSSFIINIDNLDVIVISAATTLTINSSLSGLNFLSLKYIFGNFTFALNSSTSSFRGLTFPKLEFIEGTLALPGNIGPSYQYNFDFPKLLVGKISNTVSAIQTISLPEVVQFTYTESVNSSLQEFNLPKVKVLTLTLTGTKNLLTNIYLPSLEWLPAGLTLPAAVGLVNFYMRSSLKGVNGNFITTSNSLNQASVDNILIRLAGLDGIDNLTSYYSGRTVTITGGAATPSAAGLAAKAVLVSRACTVTTN